ncbi:hypothetical protein ACIQYL_18485 [Lysinibacillus xylanilyticus]|uniref:hypothetical protein n=1 Tax=Lysinibacillus xylanilyticus TaxID=582475 RepID=UPI00381A9D97
MYTRGNRVYYETETGRIVFQTGEITNSTDPNKHHSIKGLSYVDFDIGTIDWRKQQIERIDPQTKQPVLKNIEYTKTPQEQRIDELTEENTLLKSSAVIDGLM